MKRWLVAVGLLGSTTVWAVCNLPNPNSTTIPSTQQSLGVAITSPPTNTLVPIPPGTQAVDANCAIGTVPGQPINVLYVVDVSGSTDNPGNVDTNGDNVINSPTTGTATPATPRTARRSTARSPGSSR